MFSLFISIIFLTVNGYVQNADHFSDVITSDVSVIIDELKIINGNQNKTDGPKCQLTLHRSKCQSQSIKDHETVGWDTRICFNWKCVNTSKFVMRVESCWTGSMHNPIYLIDERGCSLETTMITSPRYHSNLTQASSLGWLSVRLVGSKHIRLSCSIRLCNMCDEMCHSITPPIDCKDSVNLTKSSAIWNDKEISKMQCNQPSIEGMPSKATAAPSFSYTEIFSFVCLSLITYLLLHK